MSKASCPISAFGEKVIKKLGRSEIKRAAIVESARKVFLSKGFDVASMDLIAAEANVSKRTVYCHFKSKDNLFAHIMEDMCASKRQDIIDGDELDTSEVLRFDRPIEDALTDLAERLIRHVFAPESIAMMRILIGQTEQFPDIGREYFNQGPKEMAIMLGQYFEEMNKQGRINFSDSHMASQIFLSSIMGMTHVECLTTNTTPPDDKMIKLIVKSAVDIFLHGVQTVK